MTGFIEGIIDHGSIVQVIIREEDGQNSIPHYVNFDRRMFGHVFEGEGGNIIGRYVTVHTSDYFDEQTIEFD